MKTENPEKNSDRPAKADLEFYNTKFTKPVTAEKVLEKSTDSVPEFIENLLSVGLMMLLAASKLGKTNFAIYLAACLSQAKKVFATRTTKQCRVLLIMLSEDTVRLNERLKAYANSDIDLNMFNIEIITACNYKDAQFVKYLEHMINKRKYDVVIIDTLVDTMSLKTHGNRRREFEHGRQLRELANDTQTAIIAIHYSRKNDLDLNVFQARTLESVSDNIILIASAYKHEDREISVLRHYGRMYPKRDIYLETKTDSLQFEEMDEEPVLESEVELLEKIQLLYNYGLIQKEISMILGISQGHVSRLSQKVDRSEFKEDLDFGDIDEFIEGEESDSEVEAEEANEFSEEQSETESEKDEQDTPDSTNN